MQSVLSALRSDPPSCRLEEGAEHPLRYHELYLQYTAMLEPGQDLVRLRATALDVGQTVALAAHSPCRERTLPQAPRGFVRPRPVQIRSKNRCQQHSAPKSLI